MHPPSLRDFAAAGLIAIAMPVAAAAAPRGAAVMPIEQGFVDAGGVLVYYETVGSGEPLMLLHGGPGASHDYLLPYVLSLARTNRLVFIDERGSGKSEKLEDPKGYTVENMVEDVEAVRQGLGLGQINLLGHSFGGVLAQAYAFKYPQNLEHLILGSTFHSTKQLNQVFVKMKAAMSPELRARIDAMEKKGLFGNGKSYERGRYTPEYMIAAWGEGYFPYLYGRRPDANYDPAAAGAMSWDLYREMWGSHGEFVVDGNLASVEYADRLGSLRVPTLILVGDHDQVDPSISKDMQTRIPGSKLVVLPESGHMTFVDQPELFRRAVDEFVHPPAAAPSGATKTGAVESVVEFLLTSAATDFHNHGPAGVRVRGVRMGHATASGGEERYRLCGEFLAAPARGQAEWTPFATIKTSGYEQWMGPQAAEFCGERASVVWDEAGDLSASLQSRLDSLGPTH
jgi:proline iminopeptidase